MGETIRAKLFTHGGSQAVRLPKAFRFQGTEVRVRKEGDQVILESAEHDWPAFFRWIDSRRTGRPEDEWAELPDAPPSEEAAADFVW